MTDTPDDEPTPVEQLRDHLDEVSARPDEMQERLDDVGASLEAARRQAEADDLLPGPDGQFEGDPVWEDLGIPPGPEDVESPGGDADDSATP